MKNKGPIFVILIILTICCCGIILIAGILCGVTYWGIKTGSVSSNIEITLEPFGKNSKPEQSSTPLVEVAPPSVMAEPVSAEAETTLETLKNSTVPINDLRELAMKFEGIANIPETIDEPARKYEPGDQEQFWVNNTDTNENFQVTAVLQYVTDHVYFWIEEGVTFDPDEVEDLVETFENKTYPKNREFFGSEWTPGVDNDPHLYILYAQGGGNVGGYFSSADSVNPLAHEYSNGHETFFISADYVYLGDPEASGTLAHEFQHMIHWYRDRNEESWLNEGFSVLAEFLNGYDAGWVDDDYLSQPDIQLTYWPEGEESYPHYGASFLFVNYFLDRFGEDATKALVANPDNGMDSVDDALVNIDAKDEKSGLQLNADDFFAQWVVANYLNSPKIDGGLYSYHLYKDVPKVTDAALFEQCPVGWQKGSVRQYGVDYIRFENCSGDYSLEFKGMTEVSVTPKDAHSGSYFFWSNKGDESDMTLTRNFDFTGQDGPLTMSYWTWYDIEKDYDYVYLTASTDGGDHWEIIKTPSCTEEDPSGNSYGCGYNGNTPVWIRDEVDVSQFAGKKVILRFEYVTDAAVNGEGFQLDDIAIPQIGYECDFEGDDGGWQADGFVRIQNRLPQTFRVAIIQDGKEQKVELVSIQPGQPISVPISIKNGNDLVLAISGTTRFTHQAGEYQFALQGQ